MAGRRPAVAVFAVEDDAAQVCWAGLPAGTVVSAGGARAEVEVPGVPGAAILAGLPPATSLALTLAVPGRRPRRAGHFHTLTPPPGALLSRFATVNDLHVGERHFGFLGGIHEREAPPEVPYTERCLRAALAEALAWGAQAVVAKGDLTWNGKAPQFEAVAGILGALPVPVAAVLGNHDVGRRAVDGRPALVAHGVVADPEPFHLDLPGIRVVLGHSAEHRRSGGRISERQRARLTELVAGADGPAFLALHHYPQHFRYPLSYPPGIPGDQADALLDAVAAANPATFVSVGHSHRNRRRRHGPLVVTQIGATMHYPGAWAGYAVHEGGIRQVVRRVAAPDAIAWTERTRTALLGAWGLWAVGLRSHRCFSHPWPLSSK